MSFGKLQASYVRRISYFKRYEEISLQPTTHRGMFVAFVDSKHFIQLHKWDVEFRMARPLTLDGVSAANKFTHSDN